MSRTNDCYRHKKSNCQVEWSKPLGYKMCHPNLLRRVKGPNDLGNGLSITFYYIHTQHDKDVYEQEKLFAS